MASEPVTLGHAAFTDEEGRCIVCGGPDGHALECELQGVFAALTAVTAERDRLWALLVDEARPYIALDAKDWDQPKDVLARIDAALSTINPPSGHRRPQPCSVCRREDCTREHAGE